MVERQIDKFIKCIRLDNGGEYYLHEFSRYYMEHGINHEKYLPWTLQTNDVT